MQKRQSMQLFFSTGEGGWGGGGGGGYLESLRGHFFQDLLGTFLLIHIQNRFH